MHILKTSARTQNISNAAMNDFVDQFLIDISRLLEIYCFIYFINNSLFRLFQWQALQAQAIRYSIIESVYDYWKEKV